MYSLPLRENESRLHVYYQDISSIKYRREAMVTWDSLVGNSLSHNCNDMIHNNKYRNNLF